MKMKLKTALPWTKLKVTCNISFLICGKRQLLTGYGVYAELRKFTNFLENFEYLIFFFCRVYNYAGLRYDFKSHQKLFVVISI